MCCCFLFQAEDGIRDVAVTGVQTCALPISGGPLPPLFPPDNWWNVDVSSAPVDPKSGQFLDFIGRGTRSEERRVGKECRARWMVEVWKKRMVCNDLSS